MNKSIKQNCMFWTCITAKPSNVINIRLVLFVRKIIKVHWDPSGHSSVLIMADRYK